MLGLVERRRWLVLGLYIKSLDDPCTNQLTIFKHKLRPKDLQGRCSSEEISTQNSPANIFP